ncbi:hypothetical protein EGW08_011711 [Elysia chlorotica]|uniref:Integrase catalytic domain-containing protein n=1 Tax=Elysia chlorotica TaxID=188477 RepID=A0A433TG11_ELYCH|nr:hypothetical protein EGW08_011711 [Elysia chlorotica]
MQTGAVSGNDLGSVQSTQSVYSAILSEVEALFGCLWYRYDRFNKWRKARYKITLSNQLDLAKSVQPCRGMGSGVRLSIKPIPPMEQSCQAVIIASAGTGSSTTESLWGSILTRAVASRQKSSASCVPVMGSTNPGQLSTTPRGNRKCERFNRSMTGLLSTVNQHEKHHWPKHLAELTFCYNSTPNSTTGQSPYCLLFGREATLPLDVYLGRPLPPPTTSAGEYLKLHIERLNQARQRARERVDYMIVGPHVRPNQSSAHGLVTWFCSGSIHWGGTRSRTSTWPPPVKPSAFPVKAVVTSPLEIQAGKGCACLSRS